MLDNTTEQGFTIWLTGLSGAGKTTLSLLLEEELTKRGIKTERIDGDSIRMGLCRDLGFSPEDRVRNIERVCFVAKLLNRHGVAVVASLITPYKQMRDYCRKELGRYVEVYVKCPLDVLIERDVKGLYKKALSGEIQGFSGVSDPYEEPDKPNIVVETDKETVEESLKKIVCWLEKRGVISPK